MKIIQAADNLSVQVDAGRWQLVSNSAPERPLVTAVEGEGALAYRSSFAQARLLPAEGAVHATTIREVVVGWSRSDRAWHLGLLLGPTLAQTRGGRWCELVRWLDPAADQAGSEAQEAGTHLAQALQRPFRLVAAPADAWQTATVEVPAVVSPTEETRETVAVSAESPSPEDSDADWPQVTPSPTLVAEEGMHAETAAEGDPVHVVRVSRAKARVDVALPLDLEEWTLREIDNGLQLAQPQVWSLGLLVQVAMRIVIGIVFIALSGLSLRSPYAPVQPYGLPILGFIIGFILIYAAVATVFHKMRAVSIVADGDAREVRRHLELTSDVLDRYRFEEIRAVVVTQIAQQKHRGRDGGPDRMEHEAWLHLLLHEARQEPGKHRQLKPEDAYVTLGHITLTEGEIVSEHYRKGERQRGPQLIYADEATTPALQAGGLLAQLIGVDAYVDQR
jgi:hypothetical protein